MSEVRGVSFYIPDSYLTFEPGRQLSSSQDSERLGHVSVPVGLGGV